MVFVFPLLQKKGGEGKPIIAILHVDDYTGSLKSIHEITDLVFFKRSLDWKLCLPCSFHFLPPCPQQRGIRAQQERLHRFQITQKNHLTGVFAHQKQTNHEGRSLRKKKGECFEAFVEVSRVLWMMFFRLKLSIHGNTPQ